MATAAVTNVFANDTVMESAKVNENFQDLIDFIDTEAIHRDGDVAFTGNVEEPFMPTDDDHLTKKAYVDANIANSGIAKATVDAAGDLIVASADNTPARLAKGSDGQALTVVGGSLAWATTPSIGGPYLKGPNGGAYRMVSNKYTPISQLGSTPNNPSFVTNQIYYVGPFFVTAPTDVDGMGFAAPIVAAYTIRLAIYDSDAAGLPRNLLVEGSVAVNSATTWLVNLASTQLVPGTLYWAGFQTSLSQQTAYGVNSNQNPHGGPYTSPLYSTNEHVWQAFTHGAFPATATPVVSTGGSMGTPLLFLLTV